MTTLTAPEATDIEQQHNVYVDAASNQYNVGGGYDAITGWMAIPSEWLPCAYVIQDHSANSGKDHLDENNANCIEENAEIFSDLESALQRQNQIDPDKAWSYISLATTTC